MRTHDCHAATNPRVAIREELQGALHARCPGAYLTPEGAVKRCDCSCHGPSGISAGALEATKHVTLDVLTPHDREAEPDPIRPKEGSKEASRTPQRRCEHCGAPCRGRFAVGHDAKLKSELARAARSGRPSGVAVDAWVELLLRDWARLVTGVPAGVREAGDAKLRLMSRADRDGFQRGRTAARQSRAGLPG